MHNFFSNLRAWFAAILATPAAPDPLGNMSPSELADLPPSHPAAPDRPVQRGFIAAA